MEFGGLSLSLKFEFQKTLPSLLTVEGSYVPAAEQQISAAGLTIYMLLVALIRYGDALGSYELYEQPAACSGLLI